LLIFHNLLHSWPSHEALIPRLVFLELKIFSLITEDERNQHIPGNEGEISDSATRTSVKNPIPQIMAHATYLQQDIASPSNACPKHGTRA
jgi:hypothetical protein